MNERSVFNDSYVLSETEECRIWFASYVTAIVFVVLLNAFTLATFASNHQLRKHSTYLIINLTVADLLFGTGEGLLSILEPTILERYLPCSTDRRVVQLARTYVTDSVFPISGSLLSLYFIDFFRKVTRYNISFQALPYWRKGLL